MPFIRYQNFRTGVYASKAGDFDLKNLTGTQKLMLASSRIFGSKIGGNLKSGAKVLNAPLRLNFFKNN